MGLLISLLIFFLISTAGIITLYSVGYLPFKVPNVGIRISNDGNTVIAAGSAGVVTLPLALNAVGGTTYSGGYLYLPVSGVYSFALSTVCTAQSDVLINTYYNLTLSRTIDEHIERMMYMNDIIFSEIAGVTSASSNKTTVVRLAKGYYTLSNLIVNNQVIFSRTFPSRETYIDVALVSLT